MQSCNDGTTRIYTNYGNNRGYLSMGNGSSVNHFAYFNGADYPGNILSLKLAPSS
jgi:hypothetical protein